MPDNKDKLSPVTVSLHWLVGITIIALLAVGIYMKEFEVLGLYNIHKSTGVLIFAFILARVAWRAKNGWPEPAGNYKRTERLLAKITHWVLLAGTVIMPVSGMMMSGAGGYGFGIFSLTIMAPNPDPGNPQEVVPLNETVAELGHELHEITGYLLIAAVLLHIAGALKHHIVDKDGTLRRMLGADISTLSK